MSEQPLTRRAYLVLVALNRHEENLSDYVLAQARAHPEWDLSEKRTLDEWLALGEP